jgi:probable HAF family extracellular repeat protein
MGPVNLGFLDTQGTFTSIGFPDASVTAALGINGAGRIVGTYRDAQSRDHGFLFDTATGAITTIDVPLSTDTAAQGINGAGQIVGAFSDAGGTHGFLDMQGTFTSIDSPNAFFTEAFGINDAGEIVGGFFFEAGGLTHGFLDVGGSFTTLDFPGASATEADGINDAGQIVGAFFDSAGNVHGFVATPVPEPSTLVMFGTGIVALAGIIGRIRRSAGSLAPLANRRGLPSQI